jgi:hypothetical protein
MKYKKSDIVLVSSRAGDCIPKIHARLLERVVTKPSKGNRMDWPGYSGWRATTVYQEECDMMRKEWSIPLASPGDDEMFVFDSEIIKKIRNPLTEEEFKMKISLENKSSKKNNKKRKRRRIVRKK